MGASLEAGCHYMDLGGLYRMTGRQLELRAEFERARAARPPRDRVGPRQDQPDGARSQRERLGGDRRRRCTCAPPAATWTRPTGFSVPYALRTLIDELTMPPVVLRDGEPVEIEPLADGGTVDFGDPIGAGETIYTLHSELRTFGSSFGCREASFRLSLSPGAPRAAARAGVGVG